MSSESDARLFTLRWAFDEADLRDAMTGRRVARRQRRRIRLALALLLAAFGLLVLLTSTEGVRDVPPTYLGVLGGGVLGWLLIEAVPRVAARQQLRGNPLVRGDWEATLSSAGVRIRGGATSADHAWSAFQRLDETERAFLLSFSTGIQGPVLALPKRALTGPAEVDAVRELLHRMIPD